MTTAQEIFALFDDDGQVFWVERDGYTIGIVAVCQRRGYTVAQGNYSTRYIFADGSAIVICDGGWDLGFDSPATCHCWQGAGHCCGVEP